MQAVEHKTGLPFPKVKVAFDTLMVLISGTTCWLVLRELGSVGAGTIISAILVGTVLSFIMKAYRDKLDRFLNEGVKTAFIVYDLAIVGAKST